MIAITVKYLPCTNFKGARLKAQAGKFSVTISKPDHTQHGDETAFEAVKALCDKVGAWHDVIWIPGYVEHTGDHVFTYLCNKHSMAGSALLEIGEQFRSGAIFIS